MGLGLSGQNLVLNTSNKLHPVRALTSPLWKLSALGNLTKNIHLQIRADLETPLLRDASSTLLIQDEGIGQCTFYREGLSNEQPGGVCARTAFSVAIELGLYFIF